jgi:hypothetical protein
MLAGPAIARDVALAEVTVKTAAVVDVIVPKVAVILVFPADTPKARPLVGVVSLIVATAGLDELQLTLAVIGCVLLSL